MLDHHVRQTTASDIRFVALQMRDADADEVRAASGRSPRVALDDAVTNSIEPLTFAPEGTPAAIFGVVPHPDLKGVGAPWLLGTDRFVQHRRHIARFGPAFLRYISRDFHHLMNLADARNRVHLAWVKRLGFEVTQEVENYGHEGRTFIQFERRSHV